MTVSDIIKTAAVKGYNIFDNDSKPYNLNYWGLRDLGGQWNDQFILFWKHKGVWSLVSWMGTTDPGAYYLQNPLNVKGTAILSEGQHSGLFKLGLHRGSYDALVQAKPVLVYRDADGDKTPDIDGRQVKDTGMFGINSHRAHSSGEVITIGKYSAGCQVTLNPKEYNTFIDLCKRSADSWGSSLTYTLIKKEELKLAS